MRRHRALLSAAVVVLAGVALRADTLILRDGRRVQGTLVAVRGDAIEFDGQRGLFGRERMTIDRRDVLRIEFDEFGDRSRDDRSRDDDRRDDRDQSDQRGGGRPPGMREREVGVNASQPWTDTGITVRPGQTVYFEASGRVRWGPGRQDGPEGEHNSPRNANRPMPNRAAGALIGRVGDTDEYFYIGTDRDPIRVRGGGRLYLGINDDYLQDNAGAFRVLVFY